MTQFLLKLIAMLAMLTVCVIFLAKNHISVKTAGTLTQYLTGGTLTVSSMVTAPISWRR